MSLSEKLAARREPSFEQVALSEHDPEVVSARHEYATSDRYASSIQPDEVTQSPTRLESVPPRYYNNKATHLGRKVVAGGVALSLVVGGIVGYKKVEHWALHEGEHIAGAMMKDAWNHTGGALIHLGGEAVHGIGHAIDHIGGSPDYSGTASVEPSAEKPTIRLSISGGVVPDNIGVRFHANGRFAGGSTYNKVLPYDNLVGDENVNVKLKWIHGKNHKLEEVKAYLPTPSVLAAMPLMNSPQWEAAQRVNNSPSENNKIVQAYEAKVKAAERKGQQGPAADKGIVKNKVLGFIPDGAGKQALVITNGIQIGQLTDELDAYNPLSVKNQKLIKATNQDVTRYIEGTYPGVKVVPVYQPAPNYTDIITQRLAPMNLSATYSQLHFTYDSSKPLAGTSKSDPKYDLELDVSTSQGTGSAVLNDPVTAQQVATLNKQFFGQTSNKN